MATPSHLVVAFDAMGGYNSPKAPVRAAAEASLQRRGFESVLVGDAARINEVLLSLPHNPEHLSVHHADEVVPMAASLGSSGDIYANSSIACAAALLGDGRVDALVTAGHPGVTVLAAAKHVPMIPGVRRAGLATVIPTARRRGKKKDPFSLLLDVGATVYADADELVAFGAMGAAYAQAISHNLRPTVALLSNSREPAGAPPAVREAHARLAELARSGHFTYLGLIEGHQLPAGEADVVVCEGFTGAVTVRLLEGIAEAAVDLARAAYDKKLVWKMGLSMLSGGLEQLRKLTDWNEYGGAPLLGFTRPVMVTHASSGSRAMLNAAKVAVKAVREGVAEKIEANLP